MAGLRFEFTVMSHDWYVLESILNCPCGERHEQLKNYFNNQSYPGSESHPYIRRHDEMPWVYYIKSQETYMLDDSYYTTLKLVMDVLQNRGIIFAKGVHEGTGERSAILIGWNEIISHDCSEDTRLLATSKYHVYATKGDFEDNPIRKYGIDKILEYYLANMPVVYKGELEKGKLAYYEEQKRKQELQQERDALRHEGQRSEYTALRKEYLNRFQNLVFDNCDEGLFRKTVKVLNWTARDVEEDIISLGGFCVQLNQSIDYLVLDTEIEPLEEVPEDLLETRTAILRLHIQILNRKQDQDRYLRNSRLLKMSDTKNIIMREKERGCPSIEIGITEWKAEIPFDYVTDIDFPGKSFAFVGLADEWMAQHLGIKCPYPLKKWVAKRGGKCLSSVSMKCDYVIAGLAARDQKALETAINYRDSGKSSLKIIPEDVVLKLLNGESL